MIKLSVIATVISVFAMNLSGVPIWKNYTSSTKSTALCQSGPVIWIGTQGGLIEYNSTTSAVTVHTHASSGLPGNSINDISSDGNGGLWIATDNGVCHRKSDGSMINYADTNLSFPAGSAVAICADKSGGAWVLVYSNRIVHITGTSTFITYTKDSIPALNNAYLEDCVIDTNGTFYASLSDDGLICRDATGWKSYTVSQIAGPESSESIGKLMVDNHNVLWMCGAYGELTKYNGNNFAKAGNSPNDEGLGAIAQNPVDDSIWVGLSYTGVAAVIEGLSWDTYVSFENDEYPQINDMFFSSDGKLWVATDSGTMVLQSGTWTKIDHNPLGIISNEVHCLAPDLVNGGVWAGFDDGGAAYCKDGSFTLYKAETGKLPSNTVYSIYVDGTTTWFGTDLGLVSLSGTTWTVYTKATNGLLADNVTSLLKIGDTLWVGHYGKGLDAMVNGAVAAQFTSSPTGLPDNDVTDLGRDSSGGLWVATDGGGLAKFDGTNWTQFKQDNSGLINNDVRAIAVESNGTRWVGTTGLNRYSFAGTWKSWQVFIEPYYPAGLLCTDIAIDKFNTKWLAGSGLYSFDGTTYTGYKVVNSGIPENGITCVTIDKAGNIWAGTVNGGIAVMENPPTASVKSFSMKPVMMGKSLNSSLRQYDILGRAAMVNKSVTGNFQTVAGMRVNKGINGVRKILNTR